MNPVNPTGSATPAETCIVLHYKYNRTSPQSRLLCRHSESEYPITAPLRIHWYEAGIITNELSKNKWKRTRKPSWHNYERPCITRCSASKILIKYTENKCLWCKAWLRQVLVLHRVRHRLWRGSGSEYTENLHRIWSGVASIHLGKMCISVREI